VNKSRLASAGCGGVMLRQASSPYRSADTARRPSSPDAASLGLGPTPGFLHKLPGVIEAAVTAEGVKATAEQLDLFATKPRRDPGAQRRAFARLRAEFGDRAVARAGLREGHLPEGAFEWAPLAELPAPRPRLVRRTLVRRMRTRPAPLPYRPRHEVDGWQLRGRDDAAVDMLLGPFVLSGGWWRGEIKREYFFTRTREEEWLWVFRDAHRRRWFLHGRVE
jgi:protein ImuB